MKNLVFSISLLVCTSACGQNFKLNLIVEANYAKSVYTYPHSTIAENISPELSIGSSVGLQGEFVTSKNLAIVTGLIHNNIVFHPRLSLGGIYGSIIEPTERLNEIFSPYLKEHKFQLITIPIGIKINAWADKIVSPYFSFTFDTSIRYKESEIYEDRFSNEEWFFGESQEVEIQDHDVAFFGGTFKLGLGMNIRISEKLSILVNQQIGLWEFRAENEKFKKNNTFLYEDSVLTMSQISLGLGIQKRF